MVLDGLASSDCAVLDCGQEVFRIRVRNGGLSILVDGVPAAGQEDADENASSFYDDCVNQANRKG